MKKNIGKIDRMFRILISLLISILIVSNYLTGIFAIILIIFSIIILFTSIIHFCPIYYFLKINTLKENENKTNNQ